MMKWIFDGFVNWQFVMAVFWAVVAGWYSSAYKNEKEKRKSYEEFIEMQIALIQRLAKILEEKADVRHSI